MLGLALALRDRFGWSVIPIPRGTKRARVKWARFQRELADDATLRRWFRTGETNLAVITGSVSGGLVVRDFDEAGAYQRWAAQRPELAAQCPTVQTAQGHHVYCRMANAPRVTHFADGELRGDGGYVLLPPSVHPSGAVYRWSIELGDLPTLTPSDFDLAANLTEGDSAADITEAYRESTDSLRIADRKRTYSPLTETESHDCESGGTGRKPTNESGTTAAMRSAVLASIPTSEGQREKRLWLLARRLLAVYGPNASYQTLRPAFDLWWSHSRTVVATKSPEDSLAALLRSYSRVTTPLEDILGRCFAAAMDSPTPQWSLEFSPSCQLVAGLCRELQRYHGDKEFPLGCRTAAKTVGVSHVQAAAWLGMFVSMGVLQLVRQGDRGGGLASRYRYIADDL